VVYYRYQQQGINLGPKVTPVVKFLIIANISVFVVTYLLAGLASISVLSFLGLRPHSVTQSLHFWQLGTYMFLHGGFFHILFNMFALWMFGSDLERSWGSDKFLFYYFLTGIGAGLCDVLLNPLSFNVTIGASGAIYGILLAFGITYPNRPILIYFVIPVKAKYFVMIVGGIAFLSAVGSPGSGVSHVAHLGGMVFGYLYLRQDLIFRIKLRYFEWKEARNKKKFNVYMGKINDDKSDRWTN